MTQVEFVVYATAKILILIKGTDSPLGTLMEYMSLPYLFSYSNMSLLSLPKLNRQQQPLQSYKKVIEYGWFFSKNLK